MTVETRWSRAITVGEAVNAHLVQKEPREEIGLSVPAAVVEIWTLSYFALKWGERTA
jgi:hypothetical protein